MIRPCLILMLFFTVLTGVVYPVVVTVAAQTVFPDQANGSLIRDRGVIIGSQLIAQPAGDANWFQPRPSAVNWNAAASGASNLAPVAAPQREAWAESAKKLRASGVTGTLPADLVTASGSGLDPDLSPAGALAQVARIATARHLPEATVRALVERSVRPPQLGVLGAARVNVLELNRALTTLAGGGG
ncbi:potassium-transporting ATPase KdpC subunit [Planctomycetota bacterium]|nr:potassium-transporting ATPase KdpC subunit [Planctomycetota bacterium]